MTINKEWIHRENIFHIYILVSDNLVNYTTEYEEKKNLNKYFGKIDRVDTVHKQKITNREIKQNNKEEEKKTNFTVFLWLWASWIFFNFTHRFKAFYLYRIPFLRLIYRFCLPITPTVYVTQFSTEYTHLWYLCCSSIALKKKSYITCHLQCRGKTLRVLFTTIYHIWAYKLCIKIILIKKLYLIGKSERKKLTSDYCVGVTSLELKASCS